MRIPREIPLPNTPCQQTHKTTCVCVCVWVQGLEHLKFCSFWLLCASTPALRCLGVIPGGGLPRRLDLSCVCVLRGSLLRPQWVPCCSWCLGGTGCGVMCVWCPGEMHVQWPGWGVAVCGPCSAVSLHWWAGVYRACVPLAVSCSSC